MRRPLVCGNWKLHGSIGDTGRLIDALARGMADIGNVDVAVCPVFVHLPLACERADGTGLAIGVQDVSDHEKGAFTGEVAAGMAAEFGARLAIVGHSERRARHGETDAGVAAKFVAARRAGMTPVVCVGETLTERDAGETLTVVTRQLDAVLEVSGVAGFGDGVVAYEPVWAIGTGRTATPEQAQEVHAALRARLAEHDSALAEGTRIVYGGSMKGANAGDLMAMPDIDGGLIGGASLDADEFLAIARAAVST
ncbi:MAG: triose-phosphate isomerase [Halofilum sp. (in: g-proteobacteria)]